MSRSPKYFVRMSEMLPWREVDEAAYLNRMQIIRLNAGENVAAENLLVFMPDGFGVMRIDPVEEVAL